MNRARVSILSILALALCVDAAAATRYVNVAIGSNVGTCTNPAAPCTTITYAMAQASAGNPGDLVSVAPGRYDAAAGELFPIAMKSGTQLVSTGGAEATVVGGTPFDRPRGLLAVQGNSSTATLVRGFTFKNGVFGVSFSQPDCDVCAGGAIRVIGGSASVTIDRNIFDHNSAVGDSGVDFFQMAGGAALGGAIYVSSAAADITNNLFLSNTAQGGAGVHHPTTGLTGFESGGQAQGGAIHFTGSGKITNNTFYNNVATGGNGGVASNGTGSGGSGFAGAVYAAGSPAPNVVNNIFYGSAANSGTGGTSQLSAAGALLVDSASSINANLFHMNTVNGAPTNDDDFGTSAIHADPLFHFATSSTDLHIKFESPANASGDPAGAPDVDLDGVARPNPPARGAYEATEFFYISPTDFNDDGKSDVLWRNSSTGQVFRMLMNGSVRASEAMVYTEPNTAWIIVGDADFNGDGVTDVLWRNTSTGQVFFMPFNAGGFPSGGAFVYTEPNPAWKIVATPDLDGDSRADILWWNSSTGQIYMMRMQGSAILQAALLPGSGSASWRIEGVGDFSDSGMQNVVLWRNNVSGAMTLQTISFTQFGGSYHFSGFFDSPPPNQIVAVADFNGDFKDDILLRNPNTGAVSMMLMNGQAILFNGIIYTEPNVAWKIVAAGDYNGDGKADILWRNDSTGMIYMMLMNGPAIVSEAVVYTEPNPAWKVLGPWEYRVP
jgi:hypothetical protein